MSLCKYVQHITCMNSCVNVCMYVYMHACIVVEMYVCVCEIFLEISQGLNWDLKIEWGKWIQKKSEWLLGNSTEVFV